jgi:hypothetical protein
MELYLQQGHGMMDISEKLIKRWQTGTVIVSPRDLSENQIHSFSQKIMGANGHILIDPQFYAPRATHRKLTGQSYWIEDYDTSILGDEYTLKAFLQDIINLNHNIKSRAVIIPGIYYDIVDDKWLDIQASIIKKTAELCSDKPKYATICLSSEVIRDEERLEQILLSAEGWEVEGYYVVPEHPKNKYLVDDPYWLNNLLSFCAGLKLTNREVIVGYSGHQMLCLASANVDAIACGTFLNVRKFDLKRFDEADEEKPSRRKVWYYCPQALSEYSLSYVDLAFGSSEILDLLKPAPDLDSDYADVLFLSSKPSSVDFKEKTAFSHYLQCLHSQVAKAKAPSFKETIDMHFNLLNNAEHIIKSLQEVGIVGQDRDFRDIIDVNKAALIWLQRNRGFVLDKEW